MTVTVVSGFGRCGSSLVMQMLEAGGMQMTGKYPAFEDERANGILDGGVFDLAPFVGRAVKLLDPHRGRLSTGSDLRVIWCDRNYDEQARSQMKFLHLMIGVPQSRESIRALRRSYQKDRPKALRTLLNAKPNGILNVRFEDVLRCPMDAAKEIADYCHIHAGKVLSMASCVRRRSVGCATGMEIELELIAKREAAQAWNTRNG